MNKYLRYFVLSLSLVILATSNLVWAKSADKSVFDRSQVAEKASEVNPLLIGEMIPDVTLFDAEGQPLSLRKIAAKQPTILIFYRGGWCPFCNAQLSQIQQSEAKIRALGYQIIAISPDTPDGLKKSMGNKKLDYSLLSDFNLEATRQFGLAFYIPKKYSDKIMSIGGETQTTKGDSRSVLPVPSAFVLDQKGMIKFEYINPNYKVRVNPELLYDAAKYALEGQEK